MKKIKLLIFTKAIDGGTGSYCLYLDKLKKFFKKKVIIIKYFVLEKPSFRYIDRSNFFYFRKKNFYKFHFNLSFKNIFVFLQDFLWFKKLAYKHNPNIILGVDIYCNLIAILTKFIFFRKTKFILTTHINLDDNIEQRTNNILKFLLRKSIIFFYNKADSLVFVSKKLATDTTKKFFLDESLVNTIYNGIEIDNKLHYPQIKKNKEKIIINISRLVDQKDHRTLIKAFFILQKKLTTSQLWLISDGSLKKELQIYTESLKISNKVRFLGWVKDINQFLNQASLFVFSSKREGFGLVLVEAMSHGLPIISTNTPYGPSEILGNGKYGILVPMKNPEIMAKAIYELLTNKRKYIYYSKKSLERVKYFSLDKMFKGYKNLILKLLKEK